MNKLKMIEALRKEAKISKNEAAEVKFPQQITASIARDSPR